VTLPDGIVREAGPPQANALIVKPVESDLVDDHTGQPVGCRRGDFQMGCCAASFAAMSRAIRRKFA
jgi:hypothetical protein